MTKNKFRMYPIKNTHFLGSIDSTLAGSRNGTAPIAFWKYLASKTET
jgi:histidine decarboxylase